MFSVVQSDYIFGTSVPFESLSEAESHLKKEGFQQPVSGILWTGRFSEADYRKAFVIGPQGKALQYGGQERPEEEKGPQEMPGQGQLP
jgi:hypothetical protein